MPITKPFAIATEGPTVDGRFITRQQIEEMANSYDPAIFTALVNLDHFISFLPDSLFSAYGKVLDLDTREVDILGEKRLQLTAVANVSEAAAEMQFKGKKGFASIEIMPNFVGKGISYLTGLALTDMPASLGTEPMQFSVFSGGKTGSRYGFAAETAYEIEGDTPQGDGHDRPPENFFSKVKTLLGIPGKNTHQLFQDHAEALAVIAASQGDAIERMTHLIDDVSALTNRIKEAEAVLAENAKAFSSLKDTLDHTPATAARPPATGGPSAQQTDC